MNIMDLLSPERVVHLSAVSDKRRVLGLLSECLAAAAPSVSSLDIFDTLYNREQCASTALGRGVAIPHGRIAGKFDMVAAVMKLEQGIDYGAPDGNPVDILFALLVSTDSPGEHLEALAQLAGLFSDGRVLAQMRSARDAEHLLSVLKNEMPPYGRKDERWMNC